MLVVEKGGFLKKQETLLAEHRGIEGAFKDRLFICSPVKNKVALVNQEIDAGFELKEGMESQLGLFVRSAYPKLIQRKPDEELLEGWPGHERTMLFKRKKFKDKQGRWYRDIDFKGNGHTHDGNVMAPGGKIEGGLRGLLEIEEAFEEYRKSEEFLAEGIRAPRVLSIIKLEEIIYGNKKLSLEEARESGIIRKDFQPAILVRAFGTRARPRDISEGAGLEKETRKVILDDAKELVGEELGRDKINPLTDQEYLNWFSGTLGHEVGMMHRKGHVHKLLTSHNVTLDVRLCDLDTVAKITNDNERNEEKKFAINHCLQSMVSSLKLPQTYFPIAANTFRKTYDSAYRSGERRYSW